MLSVSSTRGLFFKPLNNASNAVTFNVSSDHLLNDLLLDVKENEAIVYWYFGSHGLKQGSIDFYRQALTQNITQGAIPFIVDLTAWSAFSSKNSSLNRYHESAVSLDGDKVKTLMCSKFFEALQRLQPEDKALVLITDILKRENLFSPSVHVDKIGITLGEVFNYKCPAIKDIYELDCAKSYSVIQYIEFLFLIEMLLLKKPDTQSIKFVLPNDEAKYYLSSIAEDLQTFLKTRGVEPSKLDIQVQCFKYGEQLSHRPYNCPSKTIPAKKKLALSHIIDEHSLTNSLKMHV